MAEVGGHRSDMNWLLLPVNGRTVTAHECGTGGFSSFIAFDRASKRGVVVLSDTSLLTVGGLGSVALHLLDASVAIGAPRLVATADGKLTDAQVQMYLKVRDHEKAIAKVAKQELQQHADAAKKEGEKSLAGMMEGFKSLGSAADFMTADIRAAAERTSARSALAARSNSSSSDAWSISDSNRLRTGWVSPSRNASSSPRLHCSSIPSTTRERNEKRIPPKISYSFRTSYSSNPCENRSSPSSIALATTGTSARITLSGFSM